MAERLITEQSIEEQRGRFRHLLMQNVWNAKYYHNGGHVPSGGWDTLKTPFIEHSQGKAKPDTFGEEHGIRNRVSTFVQHGLAANWGTRNEVLNLAIEGESIDDFMLLKKFELYKY